jgi:hypothetical protein
MRKIYQSAPDVPQAVANKVIEIIERHLAAAGVRRAEDLPEENKVHLLRELRSYFRSELPSDRREGVPYDWSSHRNGGFWAAAVCRLKSLFR